MKKRMLSLCLIASLAIAMLIPVAAAAPCVDPKEVYASFVPELADLSEDDLANMPVEEVEVLFEEIFSVDSSCFDSDYVRSAVENLSAFYRYADNNMTAMNSRGTTTSTMDDYDDSFEAERGIYFERDYDKSPLTLDEVSSNWWTVGVGYLTYDHALCLAARLDENMWDSVMTYVNGTISDKALEAALQKFFGLTGFKLTITAAALSLTIVVLNDAIDRANYQALQDATLDGNRDDLTRVMYQWTGSTVYNTYKSVSVDATYSASSELYTYRNIPNPTNFYGIWTKEEIGPFA